MLLQLPRSFQEALINQPRELMRIIFAGFTLFSLSILIANGQTITFTSSPYSSGTTQVEISVGTDYLYNAVAEASDGSEVRYYLNSGPPGMFVQSEPGVVSWQPSIDGEFEVEIRAELASNASISATQRWKIVCALGGHPGCTGKEAWLSPERGLPGWALNATVMEGELYVLHKTQREWRANCGLSKWNGKYWETLSEIGAEYDSLGEIIPYKGNIYLNLGGMQILRDKDSKVIPNTEGIAKWDGVSWSGVGDHGLAWIDDMIVHDDMLYVTGIRRNSSSYVYTIAKWDGTDWQTVFESTKIGGRILAVLDDTLYTAGGDVGQPWGDLGLAQVLDNDLKPVEGIHLGANYGVSKVIAHNDELVFVMQTNIFRWNRTKSEFLSSPPQDSAYLSLGSIASYNGELYFSTPLISSRWPDHIAHYTNTIWRLAADKWQPVTAIWGTGDEQGRMWSRSQLDFVEYNGDLYTYGFLDNSCGIPLNNIAVLGTQGSVARISGMVYHDDDRDCMVDPDEDGIRGELIEINPGPFYAYTNIGGAYRVLLPPGTYSLNVHPKHNWMASCLDPAEITLASATDVAEDINLGTDMIPGIYDVRSSLMIGRPRPGFDFTYTLTYWNSGTEPATGKVIFEYDNRLAYQSSTTVPSRQNGPVLEWDFANLPVGESISVTVTLSVPQAMPIGTELCARVDVELERKDDDEFLSDNSDFICTTVRGSYDPNDIQVTPRRYDEELGDAPLLPGDTVLSYLIRFQNTGNDTAFTVVVADTLDASLLDITSIRLGAASHDFDFDISGSGILTWTFNNILLPDSGVNELASHGYFKYTIRLRKGLPPLTQIPNHASIYFDYNAPVKTNTVVSVTSGTLSVGEEDATAASLQIYPNPVRGTSSIRLNLTEHGQVKLRLIDSRGDVIAILADKEMSAGEHTLSLDAKGLAWGAYYLVLDRDERKEIYPVVVGQ